MVESLTCVRRDPVTELPPETCAPRATTGYRVSPLAHPKVSSTNYIRPPNLTQSKTDPLFAQQGNSDFPMSWLASDFIDASTVSGNAIGVHIFPAK